MVVQYGSSTTVLDYVTQYQISCMRPQTIVDFGAGGGKYGRMIRGIFGSSCNIIAVEGFQDTAKMLTDSQIYNEVYCSLIDEWLKKNTRSYNLAIFGDVLEHLNRRDIFQLVSLAMTFFDVIIIVVPLYDVSQGEVYGNSLETHRAYISEGYFDRYKPCEKHIVKSEEHIMMSVKLRKTGNVPSFWNINRHDLYRNAMIVLDKMGLSKWFYLTLRRFDLLK